jgi:hypothetical protein
MYTSGRDGVPRFFFFVVGVLYSLFNPVFLCEVLFFCFSGSAHRRMDQRGCAPSATENTASM